MDMEKEIKFFEDNGFVIIRDFISDDLHTQLIDTCDRLYNNRPSEGNDRYVYNSNGTMNKIQGAFDYEPLFFELAHNKKLTEFAKKITGSEVGIDTYISKFFPMVPGGGESTFFHQDGYYFQEQLDKKDLVSCAIYLQDTNIDNGCLRVAKGSHKNNIVYPHQVDSGMEGIKWIDDSVVNQFEIYDFIEKGPYAVFFDVLAIHGCYVNNSDTTRYSLAWEYVDSNNNSPCACRQEEHETWCDRKRIL